MMYNPLLKSSISSEKRKVINVIVIFFQWFQESQRSSDMHLDQGELLECHKIVRIGNKDNVLRRSQHSS